MSASCSCYQTPVCWWFQGFSVPHKSWTKGWFSKLTPRYKLAKLFRYPVKMNFGISERPHPKKQWHHSQKNHQKKKKMGPKFPSGAQKTNILDSANETQIPKGSVESIMGWPPVLWLGGHFVATCEIRLYPTIWEKKTSRKRRLLKWRTINTLWLTSEKSCL